MTSGDGRPSCRRTAVLAVVLGVAAFVVLAWWRVPWHPVPGGAVRPVPVDEVYTPAQAARADAYLSWARVWSYASLAVTLVIAAWLGLTPTGARLVDRLRGPWWVRLVVAVVGLQVLVAVVTLPFAVLQHRRAERFDLTHQSWGPWTVDQLTALGVSSVAVSIALLALVACARRLPRTWPGVAGLVLAGLVMLGSFVYPVLVEPLSNHFTPLPAGPLRTAVLRLAAREGVPVDDVLVADASRRTTTLNAYVSGFGSSRRVVVYDNLLDDVDRREVLSVVGHELGHAKHDDVLTGSLLGAAAAVAGVGLLGLLLGTGIGIGTGTGSGTGAADSAGSARARRRPGVGEARAVPRILALVVIASVLASPLENAVSRRIETRADVESLRYDGDPDAFIALQRALAVTSLADPTPPAWAQFWWGSHPTARTRIAIAQRYAAHPW